MALVAYNNMFKIFYFFYKFFYVIKVVVFLVSVLNLLADDFNKNEQTFWNEKYI